MADLLAAARMVEAVVTGEGKMRFKATTLDGLARCVMAWDPLLSVVEIDQESWNAIWRDYTHRYGYAGVNVLRQFRERPTVLGIPIIVRDR